MMRDLIANVATILLLIVALTMAALTVWLVKNYTIVDDSLGSTEYLLCETPDNDGQHCFKFHDKTLRKKYEGE